MAPRLGAYLRRVVALVVATLCWLPPWVGLGNPLDTDRLAAKDYALSLTTAYGFADRTDFSQPVLLYQHRLTKLQTHSLNAKVGFRFSLNAWWGVRLQLPVSVRDTKATVSGLMVSDDESLPAVEQRSLDAGLGDPSIALYGWILSLESFQLLLEVGAHLPLDDSPQSKGLPKRVPTSSGQEAVFTSVVGVLGLLGGEFKLHYGFTFLPGNMTAYLVRRASNDSYVSGALSSFYKHHVDLRFTRRVGSGWSLLVEPSWEMTILPFLKDQGQLLQFTDDKLVQDIGLRIGAEYQVSKRHQLTFSYRHLFLNSWERDPFYPIDVPNQGFAVAWRFTSY